MLIQEVLTDLPPETVVERARTFFAERLTPYTGFKSEEGDSYIRFATEAGELTIGVARSGDRYLVRGSTSRMHHELSMFLSTLAAPEAVRDNAIGPGTSGAG